MGIWVIFATVGVLLGMGCTGTGRLPLKGDYFAAPDLSDAWTGKISAWQRRELADDGSIVAQVPAVAEPGNESPAVVEAPGTLRDKYFQFRADRKRAVAREYAEWIQQQAHQHYVADGPIDHWATLEETLRGNGDDCDGLELLVYHALRDMGFSAREVYRAIVYRPSDGQHHMVTLWFEEADDPWVIDPTGAMTSEMKRMSHMPEWVPLKVFSDSTEYTVRREREAESKLAATGR